MVVKYRTPLSLSMWKLKIQQSLREALAHLAMIPITVAQLLPLCAFWPNLPAVYFFSAKFVSTKQKNAVNKLLEEFWKNNCSAWIYFRMKFTHYLIHKDHTRLVVFCISKHLADNSSAFSNILVHNCTCHDLKSSGKLVIFKKDKQKEALQHENLTYSIWIWRDVLKCYMSFGTYRQKYILEGPYIGHMNNTNS